MSSLGRDGCGHADFGKAGAIHFDPEEAGDIHVGFGKGGVSSLTSRMLAAYCRQNQKNLEILG